MKIDLERVKKWFGDERNKTTKYSGTNLLYSSKIIPAKFDDGGMCSDVVNEDRTCFGDVINDIDDYILDREGRSLVTTYHIPNWRYGQPTTSRYGTWMTKEELYDHMSQLSTIGLDSVFECSIEEVGDGLDVTITFNSHDLTSLSEAKMILFWMRYAFEYPYNLTIVDAYLMKEMEEYKNENIIRLAMLANSIMPFYSINLPTEYGNISINALHDYLRGNRYVEDAFKAASGKFVDTEGVNMEAIQFREMGLITNHFNGAPNYESNGVGFLENERRFEFYAKMRKKYLE